MTELATPNLNARTDPTLETVDRLRSLAQRGLARMFRPEEGVFVFRVRRAGTENILEGASNRYTAIALIGLAAEDAASTQSILHGQSRESVWSRLAEEAAGWSNLGDVALTLWAGLALGMEEAAAVGRRLQQLDPVDGHHPTVEVAWALAALAINSGYHRVHAELADRVAGRLMDSFRPVSGLFPHWPVGVRPPRLRGHVACFADLVYPIQALSHFFQRTESVRASRVVRECVDQMCSLQGPEGQWWWHFDVRSGRVVERYPVYSVHQDAMAPMAVFAAQEALGLDRAEAIRRGVAWMLQPPELESIEEEGGAELVRDNLDVIWRKVARRESWKLARSLQALASRAHPALRVPGLDLVLPPGRIDYECRPYHLGWLLYAWS